MRARVTDPRRAEAERPLPAEDSPPTEGPETILVIDDDPMALQVTCRMLSHLGYRVLIAHSGREALSLARSHSDPIHVALVDLSRAHMGGAKAIPALKAARSGLRVIVCSGWGCDITAQELREAGASAHISTPVRISERDAAIREALSEP